MAIPLAVLIVQAVGAVLATRKAFVIAGIYSYFKDEINQAIYEVFEGEGVQSYITGQVNDRLAAANVPLNFSNVFDLEAVKSDIDRVVADTVNAKVGTNFQSIKDLSKDEFLEGVAEPLLARINAETGAQLSAIWPPDAFREAIAAELERQLAGDGLGGLIPEASIEKIQIAVGKKLGYLYDPRPSPNIWGPPVDDAHALKRSKARKRQEKYRRNHRLVWVSK